MTWQIRQREAELLGEKRGINVIDLQKVFDEYMQGRPGQSISWDRVHPGSVGSMLIAREVLREFER